MFTLDILDDGFDTLDDAIAAGRTTGRSFAVTHPDTQRPIYKFNARKQRGTICIY